MVTKLLTWLGVGAVAASTIPLKEEGKTEPKRITAAVQTTSANEQRWYRAKVRPERVNEATNAANSILKHKSRYEQVQESTGVPWFLVGVLHYREASLSFSKHLHEGSPLTGRTKWIPKGRPLKGNPPFTWYESAVDAMAYDKFIGVNPWTLGVLLEKNERYNGLGYRNKGLASPYLFGATTEQQKGKYVADGKFDRNVMDKQLGTVAIMKVLENKGHVKITKDRRISL
jgi:lysozyme family protein